MDESGKHASKNSNNIFAFLDIKIGKQKAGRVIIELYKDVVPKTVANFLALCRGDTVSSNGKKMHYKGSQFHRDDNDILMVDSDGCFNCDPVPKVKGRFGLAWVSESPDCPCPEPVGWQVEFLDTPSKVEQKCQEMVRWINCPPLPRCDPCPPDELCSPCNPPRCNPCAPKCNPCVPKCGLPKCTCKQPQQQQQSCCCKRKSNNNKKCCCPSNSRREKRNCYPPIGGPCCRGKSPRRRSPQRCCTCGNDDRDQLPKCTCDDVPVKDTNEGVIGSSSVMPQFMVQTGELFLDGAEDESIYGGAFDDENFSLLHGSGGAVGMANNGPNSNVSQFYITTVPCSHLDGINVVFGYVRKGLSIIRELAEMPRVDDHPIIPCIIDDCGVIKPGEDFKINESDGTLDVYPPWPDDFDSFPTENAEKIVSDIKTSGNYYFNKKNYDDSDRKYKKVLRYIDWINHSNYKHNCKDIRKLKIQTLLNLAAVKLKTHNYSDVVKICSQVLELDIKQSKAFYRRGQARLKLEEYDKAIVDFDQARKLVPNDNKIHQDHLLAKKMKQSYLQKERITCSRMFQ